MKTLLHLTLFLLCVGTATTRGETVFHYQAFQGGGKDLPNVPDTGSRNNDGTADDSVKFSSDVPVVGVTSSAGNRSFNFNGQGGVNSGGTGELSNAAIAASGGFTMEAWFFWNGGGSVNSLIDYAGTEKIVLDTSTPAGNEVRMRINSDANLDSVIGTVNPDEWHYVAAVFDTQGNPVVAGSVSGIFQLYLDGVLADTTSELTISDFGDSLDRAIGVGKHPLNFANDFFDGMVFEPRVSLGALDQSELLYVPEPCSAVLLLTAAVPLVARRRRKA